MSDTISDVMAGAFARDGECRSGDPACYRTNRTLTAGLCGACEEADTEAAQAELMEMGDDDEK